MMTPVTIGTCAGWLHGSKADRGVLICGALAHEDLCTRSSLALMAQRLAEAGVPVLRLDLTGMGQSGPLADEADAWGQWQQDVSAAAHMMRDTLGVTKLTLIGLRLGGSVLLEAAADLGVEHLSVDDLVLMAPVLTGIQHLRELASFADNDLSADIQSSLQPIDLRRPKTCPAGNVFVMSAHRDAAMDAFEIHLETLGAKVWTSRFVHYDKLMCDPLTARVAVEAVDAVVAWTLRSVSTCQRVPVALPKAAAIRGEGWQETRHVLGCSRNLAAVLTRPAPAVATQTSATSVIVVLNAGRTPSNGLGSQTLHLARTWAGLGLATLRVDLPGIGDSPASSLKPSSDASNLFGDEQRRDLGQVVDWLRAQGLSDVSFLGIGSGAYQSFHTALEDARLDKVFLVNLPCFKWGATDVLRMASWTRSRASAMLKRLRASERADVTPDAATLAEIALPLADKFAAGSASALRRLATLSGATAAGNDVDRMFRELSDRGTQTVLIYTAGDASIAELDRWMGADGGRACALPHVERHIIETGDELLSSKKARQTLGDLIAAHFHTKPAAQDNRAAA